MNDFPTDDPRVEAILERIAAHAQVDRDRLRPGERANQLGLSSLDIALALFEIEDRLDVDLPQATADTERTLAQIVEQVLACADGPTTA